MNQYIDAQCKHIIAMVNVFENACKMAALKDDGQISKDEEKAIKRIIAASTKFKTELNKIK